MNSLRQQLTLRMNQIWHSSKGLQELIKEPRIPTKKKKLPTKKQIATKLVNRVKELVDAFKSEWIDYGLDRPSIAFDVFEFIADLDEPEIYVRLKRV